MSVRTRTYLTINYYRAELVVQWVKCSSSHEPCASHLRFEAGFPAELTSSEYDARTSKLTLMYEFSLMSTTRAEEHATTLLALGFQKVQPE